MLCITGQLPIELTVGDISRIPVTVVVPALGAANRSVSTVPITVEYYATDGLSAAESVSHC